ncbi:hypothetical protein ACLOJK_012873 [Asimina triloba]
MTQAPPPKPLQYEWRPKPTPSPRPLPEPIIPKSPVAIAPDKGKLPMTPIPEYVPEIIGGASARLPQDILPVEELNPISSFLRATALREFNSPETSETESEEEPVYMADPGPSVQHPEHNHEQFSICSLMDFKAISETGGKN